MAGLPYNLENSRLLHRILFWAAGKETELAKWFSSNLNTECAAFPQAGTFTVVNNIESEQKTVIRDNKGQMFKTTLKPYEMQWFSLSNLSLEH